MDDYVFSDFGGDDYYSADADAYGVSSDAVLTGDANTPPVISTAPATASAGVFNTVQSLLGAIGTVGQTAQNLGTAVGTAQKQISTAGKQLSGATTQYTQARTAAATGNKFEQWWLYSSTSDKLMVGLAAVGVVVAIIALSK